MNYEKRRPLATISMLGVSFFHRQNPFMVAWWSASFPGFGSYLLNQYFRGTLLTLSEVIINTLAHVNEAIVFSFCGNFKMAKSLLHPNWIFGYFIIYLYCIWDSYRSALIQNKMCHLAEFENEKIKYMKFDPIEVQYLEQKSPYIAALYSFLFPGLGQLYNHQFILGFYAIFWWWFYIFQSHAHESLLYLIIGNIEGSITILDPHWLLFMPSVLGGSVYQAYITAIEHNRLYRLEQRQFITRRFQHCVVRIFG